MAEEQSLAINLSQQDLSEGLIGAQGEDFSGRDFVKLLLKGQNFFESTFNGCFLNEVHVTQSIFQHTEFTEASINNSLFEDTSFDHADFVLTNISDSEFVRCSFQNAEWRDAVFNNVRFRQCIFRNTTTSLTHFIRCSFDDSSANSFVGTSKRFSLFSNTDFNLPNQYIEFLRTNFGVKSPIHSSGKPPDSPDPLFHLSLLQYENELTPDQLYKLIRDVLNQIISSPNNLNRLKLRYVTDICKICLEENLFSIFVIQLLEQELSTMASLMPHTDQTLELIRLILTLRVSLRERIDLVEEEVLEYLDLPDSRLNINLNFEKDFSRESIEIFTEQMAKFSGILQSEIVIRKIKQGSTVVDIFISAVTFIPDIVRFIKYFLSFATVTLLQVGKMKEAYQTLTAHKKLPVKRKKTPSSKRLNKRQKELHSEIVAKEIAGTKTKEAESAEVFVNIVKDKVLVVNGKVKVTISMAG